MKPPEEKVGPPASGGTQKYDQLFVDGSTNQLATLSRGEMFRDPKLHCPEEKCSGTLSYTVQKRNVPGP
ncbi:hypothetical protein RRG08_032535 [Elysia crispata]|uniref:Uncharacterized protein n=1 Tax=Elysia crispata TaxID=231223 RepID=A0AAE0ZZD6_9GAST|nr:hypothetical protein RRG08_032535 [Elysia crispata]